MDSFKTKKGRCIVTDDAIQLESPFLARFKRTYEGNKPLFTGVMLLFGYAVVSLVVDRFIFWRAVAVWGIILGVIVIVVRHLYIVFSAQTLDDRIPLQVVTRVTLNELSRPVFFVHYERDGAAVYRAIPLPSSRYDYTEQEVATAKETFARYGFPVEEVG
jgi:hypothetical protein